MAGGAELVHLDVRSAFSLLRGASTPDALCRAARELGHAALGLADRNGVYGLPAFLRACAHHGLAPVVGVELDASPASGSARALLFPDSRAGWGALCRAITARHAARTPGGADGALDLTAHLVADSAGLVVITDHAPLLEALRAARGAGATGGLFVALRRAGGRAARLLARRLELPLLAASEVTFARPEERERHRVLRAIARGTTLGRLDPAELAPATAWLRPAALVLDELGGDDQAAAALRATAEVAARCRFGGAAWGWGVLTFPRWESPDGRPAAEVLREAALAGARARWRVPPGARLPARVEERLRRELELVVAKQFADYFLIVRDIVAGSPRTCGRGSAAASAIAYALGITHVDPVRHDLFFERFLNEGRTSPPDVDVDFPWDERDDVLLRVFARWGPRAAMVANHVCFRPRAALREVARSHGLPDHEVAEVTSRLPYHAWSREQGSELIGRTPLTRGLRLEPPWDAVLRLARQIVDLPRHLSVHPGGVVITPGPLTDLVPVETAAKGVPVIQWEKDGAEEAGLVKIDLLGNRSLAVIRDALAAAREHGHQPPDYADLAVEEDPRCVAMLARGESMGCFYVESPAMRQLQQKSRRGDFEHLVIHSSIIRPAANEFIRDYLDRLHGAPWAPLDPRLERTLEGTLGLMAYQEDVARVAIELGGFDCAGADALRKVLARKTKDYALPDLAARFRAGARARGVAEPVIEATWRMMESFAGYSFCKAHSASYALVSFQCCWLRDRFPAEFLAGVISNGGGYYSTLGYLGEARRLGLTVLPACVNESAWAWIGRERELRAGLCQLKGLRRVAAEALLAARAAGGPFRSFAELVRRVPELEKDELQLLLKAGALDGLEEVPHRARMAWRIALLSPRRAAGTLFRGAAPVADPEPPPVDEIAPELALEHELEAYGIPIRAHPLDLWAPAIDALPGVTLARDLLGRAGRRARVVGWLVTAKLVSTREDEPMEFVTLEDRTGLVEVVVFPRAYDRWAALLHAPRPVIVSGKVELEHGVPSLVARRVESWWGPCKVVEPRLGDQADRVEEELLG